MGVGSGSHAIAVCAAARQNSENPITAADVHEEVLAAGITIEKKRIHLHTPVKTLGKHTVNVKLHPEVTIELNFDVVSENPIRW